MNKKSKNKDEILKYIVEEYVSSSKPVGSVFLIQKYNLSISQCSCICRNKFWNIYDNPKLLGGE